LEIIRGLHNLRARHAGAVVTLGNFDGVHRGHQAVLCQSATRSRALGLPMTAVSFEPMPREFFGVRPAVARLSRLRERAEALAALGTVDRLLVLRFDARLARMSAEAFMQRVLADGLGARHVVVGDDFRFGRGREGDFLRLAEFGERHGFGVEEAHSVLVDGVRVSSTAIREALALGDLSTAERYLGRPYRMSGRVAHGDKRGRQIGFPTANIYLHRALSPVQGVFVVRVQGAADQTLYGVANVGPRPTVGGSEARLEVHLFDFAGDLYGRHLDVDFLHALRPEKRFDSLPELIAQIGRDAEAARAWLADR
jgi:riboflavin kinase/FMN adenylyltransferase